MSWDISLRIDTGGEDPAEVAEVGNMTYNVGPMYSQALGRSFSSLNGVTAADAIPILSEAISEMTHESTYMKYEVLNPKNGWGDRGRAVLMLERLLEACRKHPKAFINLS